ncbi:MICOS complex subunit MIC25 isoform X3 [Rousettus aegyptiacus]|uniref:MICOS complex subunit MIC25 isoform X3 n=1 Tax=Rousettus aegyptiacus TaxID=9407 RepID=UPI00168CB3E3|nr:MICOS complex subunit MIC25 isoform X3 [Rousettus aegyptiacus]
MGSTESSEGRRVSFGMDEEERVRVLQGIRLSENVVNRMKDSSQPSKGGQLTFPPAPSHSTFGTSKDPEKDSKLPRSEYGGGHQPSRVEEDLLKRYKQEQATVQDELVKAVSREREAARKHQSASLHGGKGSVDQEKQNSALLARELENQEAELRHHETFYKEQLGRIEKKERSQRGHALARKMELISRCMWYPGPLIKVISETGGNKSRTIAPIQLFSQNAEMYKLSSQQFHEAALKMEDSIKPPLNIRWAAGWS